MEEILHHLIWQISLIYRVLYITGGAGFLPPTVSKGILEDLPKNCHDSVTICSDSKNKITLAKQGETRDHL